VDAPGLESEPAPTGRLVLALIGRDQLAQEIFAGKSKNPGAFAKSELVPGGVKVVESVEQCLRRTRLCREGIQHRLGQILLKVIQKDRTNVALTELLNKGEQYRDQRTA
jgi:hypothetical protein